MSKSELNIEEIIKKAVKESFTAGRNAGYSIREQEIKNYYKQTEKRLYAYSSLKDGVNSYEEEINELLIEGIPGKSKSVVFMPSGSRINGQDLLEARIQDLNYKIQRNKREIQNIDKALNAIQIKNDNWYLIIKYKYFEGNGDDKVGEILKCDESTIRRNKKRLINKIAIILYGADALN